MTTPEQPRSVVDEQAEDEGLWFMATTAPEAYLQQELRRLHAALDAQPRWPHWPPMVKPNPWVDPKYAAPSEGLRAWFERYLLYGRDGDAPVIEVEWHQHAIDGGPCDCDEPLVERWYAAFEKVSGQEASTADGKRAIYEQFAAEYTRLLAERDAVKKEQP